MTKSRIRNPSIWIHNLENYVSMQWKRLLTEKLCHYTEDFLTIIFLLLKLGEQNTVQA